MKKMRLPPISIDTCVTQVMLFFTTRIVCNVIIMISMKRNAKERAGF